MPAEPALASRVSASDVLRVGASGLVTRKLRAFLSAVGVAIGIAAVVGVLGLSESSRADLDAQLDELGTNLLTVSPGQSLSGKDAELPATATAALGHNDAVLGAASVTSMPGSTVRRTDLVPETDTKGIALTAVDVELAQLLGAEMAAGRWLDAATAQHPAVVLGSTAASRLGLDRPGVSLYIDGSWFTVVGILEPITLAPELDAAAMIGRAVAEDLFDASVAPSRVYVRADPNQVEAVRSLLARAADPQRPEQVNASRPSEALEAEAAAKSAFTALFLGLGGVALLVGGVGIANVMVISVLERRREIGLRRALGATRRHVASQFLVEALLLAGLGGGLGALLGAVATAGYASARGWAVVVPPQAIALGVVSALLVGAIAGLYPATRAARLAPTDALRIV